MGRRKEYEQILIQGMTMKHIRFGYLIKIERFQTFNGIRHAYYLKNGKEDILTVDQIISEFSPLECV